MGENKEKLCLQRKERSYLSFQSCPGEVSSSLSSRIPSSPSHGCSNSKPERETHFRFSFKENVHKKQCLNDYHAKRTFNVVKTCKSIDSLYSINKQCLQKCQNNIVKNELHETLLKNKSRSLDKLYSGQHFYCSCALYSKYENKPNGDLRTAVGSFTNIKKKLSVGSSGKWSQLGFDRNRKVTNVEIGPKQYDLKHQNITKEIKPPSSAVKFTPKERFPNSVLLYPFPTTPVEKCFSPKTPHSSPFIGNPNDKVNLSALDTKKSRISRFEFGASFLRRFSLTQLTS